MRKFVDNLWFNWYYYDSRVRRTTTKFWFALSKFALDRVESNNNKTVNDLNSMKELNKIYCTER